MYKKSRLTYLCDVSTLIEVSGVGWGPLHPLFKGKALGTRLLIHVLKDLPIVTSEHLYLSTIFVVSHF